MDVKLVKNLLGKTVYYDTGQINFDGCRRGGRAAKTRIDAKRRHKAISSRFVLCANWMQRHVAQAELMDTGCKNSVIIVPLEKVLTKSEV